MMTNKNSRYLASARFCMPAIALLVVASMACSITTVSAADDPAAGIIAVQIREQGFPCNEAQSARHDLEASRPNEQVWILRCSNAAYRVRLVPNMAANVQRIEEGKQQ